MKRSDRGTRKPKHQQQERRFSVLNKKMTDDDEFVVIYVDRKHGNAYYDRYRNNWIKCSIEHAEGRALHLDKKSGALVCYGYGHENNNYISSRRYRIVEIDVDE